MAHVISATVGESIANGVRAKVNHFWFVEAEIGTTLTEGVDGKIRSGIGSDIVVIDSWTPADGDFNVSTMHSATAVMHAATGSTEKEIVLLDEGSDFDAEGTHDDTIAITSGVELAADAPSTSFEDYIINTNVQDATQPEDWFKTDAEAWQFVVRDNANNWDGQHLEAITSNGRIQAMYTEAGTMESGEVRTQFKVLSTGNQSVDTHVQVNVTGSGTAMRGHTFDWAGEYISLRRITSSTSDAYISGTASPKPGYKGNDVWNFAVRFIANGAGTTTYYVKYWLDTASEPASWTWMGTDTGYVAAGWVGIQHQAGYYGGTSTWDNFSVAPIPSVYRASGEWTSDPYDTTDLISYSYASIAWDETTPIDTTALVKARWKNDGTWLACTNGGEIPGITAGEDTVAGSSKDSLELRVELATTDTGETPKVENIRVYHVPLNADGIEIEVDGEAANIADGTLEVWGINQVIGGVVDEAWDEVTASTHLPYPWSLEGEQIIVKLSYGGWLISEISYQHVIDRWMVADAHMGFFFALNPIKYASGPVDARWNCQEKWVPIGKTYEWILIDRSLGMNADVAWLCGHYQLDDIPGSFLTGALSIYDYPGSLLVEGYQRDDIPASFLAQAWRRDDVQGMFMPGVITSADQPGMLIVAHRQISDQPASVQVMGVNREGAIEVMIVDAAAWAEMAARGYTKG